MSSSEQTREVRAGQPRKQPGLKCGEARLLTQSRRMWAEGAQALQLIGKITCIPC